MGVKKLYDQGLKGCIVSTTPSAEIKPIFMKDIEDPKTGKILPRLVDIKTELFQMVMGDMHVLTIRDYEKAKKYIPIPEACDFYRLLEWDYSKALLRPTEAE